MQFAVRLFPLPVALHLEFTSNSLSHSRFGANLGTVDMSSDFDVGAFPSRLPITIEVPLERSCIVMCDASSPLLPAELDCCRSCRILGVSIHLLCIFVSISLSQTKCCASMVPSFNLRLCAPPLFHSMFIHLYPIQLQPLAKTRLGLSPRCQRPCCEAVEAVMQTTNLHFCLAKRLLVTPPVVAGPRSQSQ